MEKIIQRVAVGGVLIKDNKVLILQRHSQETTYPNLWELPSGKRDFLEGTEQALIREFEEEAGVKVKIVKVISVFDYVIKKSEESRDTTQINFLVKLEDESQEVKLSGEHQKYAWADLHELDNFNLTENVKVVIKLAFDF